MGANLIPKLLLGLTGRGAVEITVGTADEAETLMAVGVQLSLLLLTCAGSGLFDAFARLAVGEVTGSMEMVFGTFAGEVTGLLSSVSASIRILPSFSTRTGSGIPIALIHCCSIK